MTRTESDREFSGEFRGGRAVPPPPLGRRTDAVTVLLISDNATVLQGLQLQPSLEQRTDVAPTAAALSPAAAAAAEVTTGPGAPLSKRACTWTLVLW